MKNILIKLTTASGKVIKSITEEHSIEIQATWEKLASEVPEMKYLILNTDSGPVYIYGDTLATCVIELVIYKGADKS